MQPGRRRFTRGEVLGLTGAALVAVALIAVAVSAYSSWSIRAEIESLRDELNNAGSSPVASAPTTSTGGTLQQQPSNESKTGFPHVLEPGPHPPATGPQDPAPVPPPRNPQPAPICPQGDVIAELMDVTVELSTPSNTGDADWDIMSIRSHVLITNRTNHAVNGVARAVVEARPGVENVSDVTAFTGGGILQPGASVNAYASHSALRRHLDKVESWVLTHAIGQFFFQDVDPRCPSSRSINLVIAQ